MATFIKAGFWDKLCKPCKGYKGWLNLDELIQSFIPKPTYKVFTALLYQSGEYQPYDIYNGTDLYIGVTYIILGYEEGTTGDFTNVGAPNNEIGTFFMATGTTPNSWGDCWLQYDSGSPVVTVLENTIGNIWFSWGETGLYFASSNGLFTLNKTAIIFGGVYISPFGETPTPIGYGKASSLYDGFPNLFAIECVKTQDGLRVNDALRQTTIEIRVYN